MLGYMTKRQALKNGFTHHGTYYGIPIWITDEDCPMVAAKWLPFELLMSLGHYIEGLLFSTLWPNEEPFFRFLIGKRIT